MFSAQPSAAADRLKKTRLLVGDDAPWQITAKKLTYNDQEKTYTAEGDVVISKNNQVLKAQKVLYNVETGDAEVRGNMSLESGGDILRGERGSFNLKSRKGRIDNGSLFLSGNNFYLSGEIMEKLDEDTYRLNGCSLTTCDGPSPAWSITGSEVQVTIEGYGTVKHAAFRVRDVPVLYFPYFIFPAKTKRQTGLLPPRAGYSGRIGADVEVPFFWAISDQADATFYQRYMSKRGYMQGIEFRYRADENSMGNFLFNILSDREDEKDMSDPDEVELSPFSRRNSTRYWLRGRADQDLPLGLVARLDGDYVSDQDYLKEFERGLIGFMARPDLEEESRRPFEEKNSPIRSSVLRLSRDFENFSLQAGSSYYQRPEDPPADQTPQPTANILFQILPERLMEFPAYFSLESDYGYIWRDEGLKGNTVALSPELRTPFWLGPYIEVEPMIHYTIDMQWVDDEQVDGERYTRSALETGARMSTNLEKIYDINWQDARRLKHRIRPELSYVYRMAHGEDDERPWFEEVDQEGKLNQITFSLENFLDARLVNEKGEVTYRQWATFHLRQGYDIDEKRRHQNPAQKRKPFLPLSAELIVRPFPNLDLRGSAQWDHYDHEVASSDLSLDLSVPRSGKRTDTYSLDYQYNEYAQKSLNFWVDINLIYRFSVGSSLERDLDLSENISNSYWLQYKSQCWGVKLVGEREDDDTSITLLFQLMGLGEIRAF